MNERSRSEDTKNMTPHASPQMRGGADLTHGLEAESRTARLVAVLDRYIEDLKAGRAPSHQSLMAAHPQLASQLEACLAGADFIHHTVNRDDLVERRLGDFLIGRELGRGGMGAVYLAQQISLGRQVALKVLRFGGVADVEAVDRFRREAETVANLHHTNIVPIFSIGSEGGVNYYAMQYIAGRSLDRVLSESDQSLDPHLVAEWGLQAADALAHAHQRDVIHRDVKPSNLLLDDEGRIWLTDFGLAKRLDDVKLSMTGALLGTPQYMSPEQAEASLRVVDHRTDIYSLGATLYELVTGRPVFSASTAHEVITQILNREPVAPRTLRRDLPRDLETVLLKCLCKDASQRYATAKELAEDLRAVVERRPIRARRAHPLERAARWLRTRKRNVTLAVSTALLTLVLVILFLAGKGLYRASQTANLLVLSKSPGLVAEITSAATSPRVESLPTAAPIEVSSGDLRLHVYGDGHLSQHFHAHAAAGRRTTLSIALDDQRLGDTITVDRSFCLVPFSDGVAPVLLNQDSIMRWDVAMDAPLWTQDLTSKQGLLRVNGTHLRWPARLYRVAYATGDKFDHQPFVVGELPLPQGSDVALPQGVRHLTLDLDLDGETDILVASREQAWLLALSGRTGSLLWLAARGSDIDLESSIPLPYREVRSAVVAPPLVIDDVDGDGARDLIVSWADVGDTDLSAADKDHIPVRRWLEAISGKTGEEIWRVAFLDDWFSLEDDQQEVPYAFRWFVGHGEGSLTSGPGAVRTSGDLAVRSRRRAVQRTGRFGWIPDIPQLITLPPTVTHDTARAEHAAPDATTSIGIACIAGRKLVLFESHDGSVREVQDCGVLAALPARYADMDGDDQVDVVLAQPQADLRTPRTETVLEGKLPQMSVAVWCPTRRELLWQRVLTAHWPNCEEWGAPAPTWPVVTDLNGDGACEILVPNGTSDDGIPLPRPRSPWGKLAVIAGATGEQLWEHRLFTLDQQLDHFLAGPDINNDGWREVYVAGLWGRDFHLFVDALSGADGTSLWRSQYSPNRTGQDPREYRIARLGWWSAGRDGWPQLNVALQSSNTSHDDRLLGLFSTGTGRLSQLAAGAEAAWYGDANRDGLEDLFAYAPPDRYGRSKGELSIYHGVAAEYWRRLGDSCTPVHDFDGDGVRDLLQLKGSNNIEVTSGISHEVLWSTTLATPELGPFEELTRRDAVAGVLSQSELRQRDFDQDGTPDLLLAEHSMRYTRFSPLHAVSGRDGSLLWQADVAVNVSRSTPMIAFTDLDRDDRTEILYVGAIDLDYQHGPSLSSHDVQLWLIALSASDGSLRWKRPLTPAYGSTPGSGAMHLLVDSLRLEAALADLNGDGFLDVILPSEANVEGPPGDERTVEMVAISGSNGMLLWRHALPQWQDTYGRLKYAPPALAIDLDGNGRCEIALLVFEESAAAPPRRVARVQVLDGESGQVRWEWACDVDASFGTFADTEEMHRRPRLVQLRVRSGVPKIGAVLHTVAPDSGLVAAILDATGEIITRIPLAASPTLARESLRVFPYDVDQDGDEEIIYWHKQALMARKTDRQGTVVWQERLPTVPQTRLEGVFGARDGEHATGGQAMVVLRQGDNSLVGIDAASGSVRWVCPGPRPGQAGERVMLDRAEILGGGVVGPPQVFYRFGELSLARQAAAPSRSSSGSVGRRMFPTDALLADIPDTLRTAPVTTPATSDPRTLRDLPWNIQLVESDTSRLQQLVVGGMAYCLSLIVVPVLLLVWVVRRGRLDVLAAGAVVMGMMSLGMGLTMGELKEGTSFLLGRFLLGLAMLPPLAFIVVVMVRLMSLRWRRAIGALAVSVVFSVVLAAGSLGYCAWQPILRLDAGESYSLAGWYRIWLWGIYVTGVAMLAILANRVLYWGSGRLWRWWRGAGR